MLTFVRMLRKTLLGLLCFLAIGCATVPERQKVAAREPTLASKELECMGDCLEEGDTSCDDCAVRCFAPPTGVLVTLSR